MKDLLLSMQTAGLHFYGGPRKINEQPPQEKHKEERNGDASSAQICIRVIRGWSHVNTGAFAGE